MIISYLIYENPSLKSFQNLNQSLWKTKVNGPIYPTHQVNDAAVDKPYSLWTKEEKIKIEIDLKSKNFIIISLDDFKLHDVRHCKTAKKIWDTLDVIYEGSPSIEREKMNTRDKEYIDTNHECFSIFRNIKFFC